MEERKFSYPQAFLWIFFSTLLVSGSAWFGWFYYLHLIEKRVDDPRYEIRSVVQGSLNRHLLKTEVLLELLQLSEKEKANLYRFNSEEGAKKLLTSPLLKSASIKRKVPNTLYILYEMRDPIAYLGDFPNTVLDEEGYLFPFHPFYTPKKLPTLYFKGHQSEPSWGSSVASDPLFLAAIEILRIYQREEMKEFYLRELDLSCLLLPNTAARDFKMTLREKDHEWFHTGKRREFILRLNADTLLEGLKAFRVIYRQLFPQINRDEDQQINLDLRLPGLAFIQEQKYSESK